MDVNHSLSSITSPAARPELSSICIPVLRRILKKPNPINSYLTKAQLSARRPGSHVLATTPHEHTHRSASGRRSERALPPPAQSGCTTEPSRAEPSSRPPPGSPQSGDPATHRFGQQRRAVRSGSWGRLGRRAARAAPWPPPPCCPSVPAAPGKRVRPGRSRATPRPPLGEAGAPSCRAGRDGLRWEGRAVPGPPPGLGGEGRAGGAAVLVVSRG